MRAQSGKRQAIEAKNYILTAGELVLGLTVGMKDELQFKP